MAIVGPPHRRTGSEGYFYLDFKAGDAPALHVGTPVVYLGHSAGGEYIRIGPRETYPYGPGGTRGAPGTL